MRYEPLSHDYVKSAPDIAVAGIGFWNGLVKCKFFG